MHHHDHHRVSILDQPGRLGGANDESNQHRPFLSHADRR